jgi:hypothetical protein
MEWTNLPCELQHLIWQNFIAVLDDDTIDKATCEQQQTLVHATCDQFRNFVWQKFYHPPPLRSIAESFCECSRLIPCHKSICHLGNQLAARHFNDISIKHITFQFWYPGSFIAGVYGLQINSAVFFSGAPLFHFFKDLRTQYDWCVFGEALDLFLLEYLYTKMEEMYLVFRLPSYFISDPFVQQLLQFLPECNPITDDFHFEDFKISSFYFRAVDLTKHFRLGSSLELCKREPHFHHPPQLQPTIDSNLPPLPRNWIPRPLERWFKPIH